MPCGFIAIEKGSRGRLVVAGALLGLLYLLKEMALIFLPLPLWMTIAWGQGSRQDAIRVAGGLAGFLAGFLVVVLPWWLYVARVSGDLVPLGGGAGPGALRGLLEAGREGFPWVYVQALATYYEAYVVPNFGLALLLGVSWIFALVRGFWRREGRAERALLAMLLCVLPLLVLQGIEGFRARQGIVFFLLSYVALGGSVRWALGALGAAARSLSLLGRPAALWLLVGVGLLLGQLAAEGGRWGRYLLQYNVIGALATGASGQELRWVGWLREETRQAAEWLLREVPEGTPILSDWQFRTAVYFLAQGRYPLFKMPLLCSRRYSPHICVQSDGSPSGSNSKPKVLFLWPDAGGVRHALTQYELVALTEEALFEALERTRAQYVLVTLRTNFESLYFDRSASFEKVADFGRGMLKLYRPTHVGGRTAEYLKALQVNDPDKHKRILAFLQGRLRWTLNDVRRLLQGGYPLVELHKRYGL